MARMLWRPPGALPSMSFSSTRKCLDLPACRLLALSAEIRYPRPVRPILIALTGNSAPEDRDRLLAAGFDSVLAKPFRLEALTSLLSDPAHIPPESPPDIPPEAGSLEDILKRVGGDKKLLRQMIATFLRDTPKRLAAIRVALKRKRRAPTCLLRPCPEGFRQPLRTFPCSPSTLKPCNSLVAPPISARRVASTLCLQEEIAKLLEKLRGYAKETRGKPPSVSVRAKSKPVVAGRSRRSPNRKRHKSGARRKK